ncbi:hypothetical protein H2198_010188, partial [Neophaeococcomyces mojaviensis]
MSDASGPGRRGSYAGSANVPRRLSYASVVTGANTLQNPTRSGVFAQNTTAAMANNSYPPQYQPDPRLHARPAAQEHDMTMYGSGSGHRRGPSFSSQPRGTSGADETSMDECWMPAYLEKTRYAKKLRDAQDARKRNLRDQDVSNTGLIGSIWNRPSNARIAPSHRGMTYDIIESNPPHEDDITPLPSRLSATDKSQGLDISSDGLEV